MNISEFDNPEVWSFIQAHQNDDLNELMLKANKWPDLPIKEIVRQMQSREKAKTKLPEWYANDRIIFPESNYLEQASSQQTARYKSELIRGKKLLDLTGGSGVDSFYLSRNFDQLTIVEPNRKLIDLLQHNFNRLGVNHVRLINSTAEDYVTNNEVDFDVIYLDPSRRREERKVVGLEDCQPDVLELLPLFSEKAKIYLKASPLLDIDLALKQLDKVDHLSIIAVNNECKELLFSITSDGKPTQIETINLRGSDTQQFSFLRSDEKEAVTSFSAPITYLYEPNAAIMKSGAFKCLSPRFGIEKLGANSHLYTSAGHKRGFPGRTFLIKDWTKFSWKSIQAWHDRKANITVRNFPHSVKAIRKKSGVKEGGDTYLFFTRLQNNTLAMINCQKIAVRSSGLITK